VLWAMPHGMTHTRQMIYDKLKEVARAEDKIYYQELGSLVGLDMHDPGDVYTISQLLGNINEEEVTVHQRPMLSAIVLRKDEGIPGPGFWVCARSLGLYTGGDEVDFWVDQVKQVYANAVC